MFKPNLIFVFFVMIFTFFIACESAVPTALAIKKQGTNWTLELPKNIRKAIQTFDADFRPWELKDYSPRIRNSYKESDPKESPFALIVDINNDGTLDVIIDGHDKKRDLLISAVSDHARYKIHIIKEDTLSDPKTIENWNEKKKEKGLNYFLWLNKDKTGVNKSIIFQVAYPQVEFEDGTATDGAIVEYLYEHGEFKQQVNEL